MAQRSCMGVKYMLNGMLIMLGKRLIILLMTLAIAGCALVKPPRLATDNESVINSNIIDGKTTKAEVTALYQGGKEVGKENNGLQTFNYENLYATPFGTYQTHTRLIVLYKNDQVLKHHLLRYKNYVNNDFVLKGTKEQFDADIKDGVTRLQDIRNKYGNPWGVGYEKSHGDLFYVYSSDNVSGSHFAIGFIDSRLFTKMKVAVLTIVFTDNGVVQSHNFGSNESYLLGLISAE